MLIPLCLSCIIKNGPKDRQLYNIITIFALKNMLFLNQFNLSIEDSNLIYQNNTYTIKSLIKMVKSQIFEDYVNSLPKEIKIEIQKHCSLFLNKNILLFISILSNYLTTETDSNFISKKYEFFINLLNQIHFIFFTYNYNWLRTVHSSIALDELVTFGSCMIYNNTIYNRIYNDNYFKNCHISLNNILDFYIQTDIFFWKYPYLVSIIQAFISKYSKNYMNKIFNLKYHHQNLIFTIKIVSMSKKNIQDILMIVQHYYYFVNTWIDLNISTINKNPISTQQKFLLLYYILSHVLSPMLSQLFLHNFGIKL